MGASELARNKHKVSQKSSRSLPCDAYISSHVSERHLCCVQNFKEDDALENRKGLLLDNQLDPKAAY